jgi:hypothetical protein
MANAANLDTVTSIRPGHLRILSNVFDLPQKAAEESEWSWRLVGWVVMAGVSAIAWGGIILAIEHYVR